MAKLFSTFITLSRLWVMTNWRASVNQTTPKVWLTSRLSATLPPLPLCRKTFQPTKSNLQFTPNFKLCLKPLTGNDRLFGLIFCFEVNFFFLTNKPKRHFNLCRVSAYLSLHFITVCFMVIARVLELKVEELCVSMGSDYVSRLGHGWFVERRFCNQKDDDSGNCWTTAFISNFLLKI